MNEIVKVFDDQPVRIIDQNGETWFVAVDVCKILEIKEMHRSVRLLDEDERHSMTVIDNLGRSQETTVINEAGLYSLVLRSRKPQAKAFKRWVCHEVLPSIRRNGTYLAPGLNAGALSALLESMQTSYQALIESNALLREKVEYLRQYEPSCEYGEQASNGKPRWLVRRGCWVSGNGRKAKCLKPAKGQRHLQIDLFLDYLPGKDIAAAIADFQNSTEAQEVAND